MTGLGWRKQYQRYKELFLNILPLYQRRPDLRMFLEIILSLVTIIIFSLFALKPTILTIVGLIKETNKKEEVISLLNKKIDNLERARSLADQESQSIEIVKMAIPSLPDPEVFSRQVEGIAAKNGVKVLGISVSQVTLLGKEAKNAKNPGEMPVSISVNGNYPSLLAFIRDLEALRRPIKINSLGIKVTKAQEGKSLVMVISGSVPFFQQK